MPLPTIDDVPWGVAVRKGEPAFAARMSGLVVKWHLSGLIIDLEKKYGLQPPPKARVEDAEPAPETMGDKLERKRDYLEGFLAAKPAATDPHGVGGDLYEAVIDALKEIYDPEIPVNIYDLGLIYNVEIDEGQVLKIGMEECRERVCR